MLEIRNLRKRFGEKTALDDVSLTVEPGQVFGFVGANGAGKTTTMRIAMGVLIADSGDVLWDGEPMGHAQRLRTGYMPEERGLYPKMKIGEQLAYFAELHGETPGGSKKAAATWLERLGLSDRSGDFVQDLSLGNQQRVQLAVSLVHDPKLLILDEPFSGLDPIAVDTMATVLSERSAAGVPVIFSSHQLDLVERLSDSVGIIAAGNIVASGSVDDLRRRGNRKLRVSIDGAAPTWADALPGEVANVDEGEWVIDSGDDQKVLAAAMAAGRVTRFGFDEPSLVDIFRETVS
ncbi:ABC transporter ATP-binding protein [Stackebrandtia nassauensis]|uniref:ABC transporter related protein n=1 Tax=Stackebrandtia nassauensis (strain DSM 44728 / CIP 108903 / NRRL B-16338 / NBRC 102104 / LLR-40K-21) TaxID=446470 RepID=D3Q5Z6_STANL|nr:ATP-binding cassette domain-containing protein [Stackebrandtia nassauensis]ADD40295.1 ABC transporter related protein [Stackebrandtia nassauensis DSM 44728]